MQEQTHITQLLEQNKLLLEMVCAMQNELKELREELKPAIKFFKQEPEPPKKIVKRLSKKEKEKRDIEEHYKMLEQQSFARIKKG